MSALGARFCLLAVAMATGLLLSADAAASATSQRFREANAQLLAGDYLKGIAIYAELAARGNESASLYWNWAQAARARGATGEALWALLRAREVEPGDRALEREIERLRTAASLDPAELNPEPLAAVARFARRYQLDRGALALLALSVGLHAVHRWRPRSPWAASASVGAVILGLTAVLLILVASLARPTAVVIRRDAPLLDSASPTARVLGSLREGEVMPILEEGGDFLRLEDSSGARGWVHGDDLLRLDRPPRSSSNAPKPAR